MVDNPTDINKTYNPDPDPGLWQAEQSGGFNRVIGSQPSPLDNYISKGNTYINKR
jgi:hypothetical protein